MRPTADRPVAEDTPIEMEALQQDLWRRMTPEAKAHLVAGLCQGVRDAALQGIRFRYPQAGPREQFLRWALLSLGPDLTVEAFPDAAGMASKGRRS